MLDLTPFAVTLIHLWALVMVLMMIRKTWRMWGEVKWERKRNLQLWESHTRALAQIEDAIRQCEAYKDLERSPWVLKQLEKARYELKTNPHRRT